MGKSGVDHVPISRVDQNDSRTHRLLLIDGNAVLHRAYHALPPLTAPDGSVVNAVYGFASVLIKLFNDLKPTHMAVAFDRPEPTFRKKLFKDYQATRPVMEDNLVSQIDRVHDLVRAFGIPIYEQDGFEADDMLGTIASKVVRDPQYAVRKTKNVSRRPSRGWPESIDEVVIVTPDRDILQLVQDGQVKVFMPTKGISEGKLYGETEVIERMGVSPRQIPDFKALAGDAADNYPGVAGIGPKTAVELVNAFGSIEHLYQLLEKGGDKRVQNISKLVKIKLVQGKKSALLSKHLAMIRDDAPVNFNLDESQVLNLDRPRARAKLAELNFQSLLKRLDSSNVSVKEKSSKKAPSKRIQLPKEQLSLI